MTEVISKWEKKKKKKKKIGSWGHMLAQTRSDSASALSDRDGFAVSHAELMHAVEYISK